MSDLWEKAEKAEDEMFCSSCGEVIKKAAEVCPRCGVRYKRAAPVQKKSGWMYFADAMKKYAVFKGRARRAEYWWFTLFVALISSFIEIIIALLISVLSDDIVSSGISENKWIHNLVSLAFLLPTLAVGWRRMHDVGKPGPYIFIPIYSFILAVTAGNAGPNEYGPNPKDSSFI